MAISEYSAVIRALSVVVVFPATCEKMHNTGNPLVSQELTSPLPSSDVRNWPKAVHPPIPPIPQHISQDLVASVVALIHENPPSLAPKLPIRRYRR